MTASASDWRPTVADVAAVIAHRTGDPEGEARTSFASDTVPTADQVETLILQIMGEVATKVGPMPDELATPVVAGAGPGTTPAGQVVAIGAAARIELQFWPDQQQGGEAPSVQLRDWYRTSLADLVKAAHDLAADGEPGAQPLRPVGYFPAAVAAGRGTTLWETF